MPDEEILTNPATGPDEGQPDAEGEEPEDKEASPESLEGKEADAEGTDLEKDYKELQRKLTAVTTELSELGGVESLKEDRELLKSIVDDPKFQKILAEGGEEPDKLKVAGQELTPEQEAGLDLVRKITREEITKAIQPIAARESKRTTDDIFEKMDEKYGNLGVDWNEYRPEMQKFLKRGLGDGSISQAVEWNPTFDTLDALFLKVYSDKEGGLEKIGAKAYEAKLKAAKLQATGKPVSSPEDPGTEHSGTVRSAFSTAVKKHGGLPSLEE